MKTLILNQAEYNKMISNPKFDYNFLLNVKYFFVMGNLRIYGTTEQIDKFKEYLKQQLTKKTLKNKFTPKKAINLKQIIAFSFVKFLQFVKNLK